jgi:hypothetical protein
MPAAPPCAQVADNSRHTFGARFRDAQDVCDFILDNAFQRSVIQAARSIGLPDGAIGAGFVRQPIWDCLHGYQATDKFADIDILYFDPSNLTPESELRIEQELGRRMPGVPWEVTNQARMHISNGDLAYRDTEDAIVHWLETPTALAVRLEPRTADGLIAPFGLVDLLAIQIKPTPAGVRRSDAYRKRLRQKDWHQRWPKVRIYDIDGTEIVAEELRAKFE